MAIVGEFGTSKHGNRTFIYQNYEFWKHKTNKQGHTLWMCSKKRVLNCGARLKTLDRQVIGNPYPKHNHPGKTATSRMAVQEMHRPMQPEAVPSQGNIGATPPVQALSPKRSPSHAKKYILIDPHQYTQPEKPLSALNREMQAALNMVLPQDDKLKLYDSILKKYNDSTIPSQPETKRCMNIESYKIPLHKQRYKPEKIPRYLENISDNMEYKPLQISKTRASQSLTKRSLIKKKWIPY